MYIVIEHLSYSFPQLIKLFLKVFNFKAVFEIDVSDFVLANKVKGTRNFVLASRRGWMKTYIQKRVFLKNQISGDGALKTIF